MADALGMIVDFTPKYHPELAGEGIEYTWGFAKNLYRRKDFKAKKLRSSFVKLVDECISRQAIDRERVRRFSGRARSYILTYLYLDGEGEPPKEMLLKKEIENLCNKVFCTHRSSFGTNKGFLGECENIKIERDD